MKKSNFEEEALFKYRHKQLFTGCLPAISTSLTRHCCANNDIQWFFRKKINLYLKYYIKKGFWSKEVHRRIRY